MRRIYGVPLILAVASLAGLVAALLTDGGIDLLWTAAVGLPLGVIAFKLRRLF
jgi:hypothetical protein